MFLKPPQKIIKCLNKTLLRYYKEFVSVFTKFFFDNSSLMSSQCLGGLISFIPPSRPLADDAPPPKAPPQILVPPFHSNPTNISYKETKQRIILSLLYTLHTKHTIQLFYLLSSEISSTWILNCADLLLITNRREKIEKKDLCCCVLLYFHGLHKSGGFFILGGVVKYQNGKWKSMVTRQCCQLIYYCRTRKFQGENC